MTDISKMQALVIVLYLLPGFVGMFLYEALANTSDNEKTKRVTSAITIAFLSIFLNQVVFGGEIVPILPEKIGTNAGLVFSNFLKKKYFWNFPFALLIGLIAAIWSNKNWTNKLLSKLTQSKKTGNEDVWQQVLLGSHNKYCKIIFQDGNQIIGFPRYYSMNGEDQQLFLVKCYKRTLTQGVYTASKSNNLEIYINNFDLVKTIEFV